MCGPMVTLHSPPCHLKRFALQARAIEDGIYSVECQLYAAKADLDGTDSPAQPGKPMLQLRICAWSSTGQPVEASAEKVRAEQLCVPLATYLCTPHGCQFLSTSAITASMPATATS